MEYLINNIDALIKSFGYNYIHSGHSFIIYHPDNKMEMSYNITTTNNTDYIVYISMWEDNVDTSMFIDNIDEIYFHDITFNNNECQVIFETRIKPSIIACLNGYKNGFQYFD